MVNNVWEPEPEPPIVVPPPPPPPPQETSTNTNERPKIVRTRFICSLLSKSTAGNVHMDIAGSADSMSDWTLITSYRGTFLNGYFSQCLKTGRWNVYGILRSKEWKMILTGSA